MDIDIRFTFHVESRTHKAADNARARRYRLTHGVLDKGLGTDLTLVEVNDGLWSFPATKLRD